MSTAVHGSSTYFALDNAAASLIDLSAHSPEVSPELIQAMHDKTVFGDTAQEKVPGLKDGKFSVTLLYNATTAAQLNGLYNAQTPGSTATWTVSIGPMGSGSGNPRYTGECILTNLAAPSKVDDLTKVTAQFEITNGWTANTF